MTDTTNDGWPEEYRDPRTRPHPDTVRVTVEGFEHLREETQALARDIADGQEQPAVVSFRSVAELRRIHLDVEIVGNGGTTESVPA